MDRINFKRLALLSSLLFLPWLSSVAEERIDRVQGRGDLTIKEGETVDRAVALMGSVHVDGLVRENAVSVFGDVTIGPKGKVQGDAVSIGGRIVRIQGSKVGGKEVSLGVPIKGLDRVFFVAAPLATGVLAVLAGAFVLAYTIGVLALIVLVLTVFDKQVAGAQNKLVDHPARSFLLGLAGFICALPVLFLLAITIIGIPLAFVGAVVVVAAIVLGTVAVGQWVGTEVTKRFKWTLQPVWSGLLGMTLLFLVSLIPVVGWIIHAGVHVFGLGAVMQSRFGAAAT